MPELVQRLCTESAYFARRLDECALNKGMNRCQQISDKAKGEDGGHYQEIDVEVNEDAFQALCFLLEIVEGTKLKNGILIWDQTWAILSDSWEVVLTTLSSIHFTRLNFVTIFERLTVMLKYMPT